MSTDWRSSTSGPALCAYGNLLGYCGICRAMHLSGVNPWMERALAAESQVAALTARVRELEGERDEIIEWSNGVIERDKDETTRRFAAESQVAALSAQVEAYRGLETAAREAMRDLGTSSLAYHLLRDALAALSDKEEE